MTPRCYRCRYCGTVLPSWYPVPGKPNGAMLLHHLSARHPTAVGPYLTRMATEDITTVTLEAFAGVEAHGDGSSPRTA
jgi:hypothetical protein